MPETIRDIKASIRLKRELVMMWEQKFLASADSSKEDFYLTQIECLEYSIKKDVELIERLMGTQLRRN